MELSTSWRIGMYSFLLGFLGCSAWAVYEAVAKPEAGAFWIACGWTGFFGVFALVDWMMLRRTRRDPQT